MSAISSLLSCFYYTPPQQIRFQLGPALATNPKEIRALVDTISVGILRKNGESRCTGLLPWAVDGERKRGIVRFGRNCSDCHDSGQTAPIVTLEKILGTRALPDGAFEAHVSSCNDIPGSTDDAKALRRGRMLRFFAACVMVGAEVKHTVQYGGYYQYDDPDSSTRKWGRTFMASLRIKFSPVEGVRVLLTPEYYGMQWDPQGSPMMDADCLNSGDIRVRASLESEYRDDLAGHDLLERGLRAFLEGWQGLAASFQAVEDDRGAYLTIRDNPSFVLTPEHLAPFSLDPNGRYTGEIPEFSKSR